MFIPDIFTPHYVNNVFHSLEYLKYKDTVSNEDTILVVGQGQSSLEVILDLLSNNVNQPAKIIWIGRKEHLSSMDDNPFVDNLYTPWFTENFYRSNEVDKLNYIEKIKYTSDGVSPKSAADLAQLIIKEKLSSKIFMCNTVEVENIVRESNNFKISSQGKNFKVNKIILCTGSEQKFPYLLLSEKLKDEIVMENNRPKVSSTGKLILKKSFLNIYINGLLVNDFGLTEKNLATCAWRNAKIVNEITGCNFYNTNFEKLVKVFEEV